MTPASAQAESSEDEQNKVAHDRVVRIHGTYSAFIAAAVVSLISGDGHIKTEGWAIALWTLSLPWLVAYLLLDFSVRTQQKRQKSATRGLTAMLGYALSNLGTAAILANFSWIAAAGFIVSILVCILYVSEVAVLGFHKTFKDL
jgi:hypothetical protein